MYILYPLSITPHDQNINENYEARHRAITELETTRQNKTKTNID